MSSAARYAIAVRETCIEGDMFFEATAKEFPDIREYGDTPSEAYDLARETIEHAIEVMRRDGTHYPAPSRHDGEYSGRITLRLAKSLHRAAAQLAEEEGVSLNLFLSQVIAHAVGILGIKSQQAVINNYFFPHDWQSQSVTTLNQNLPSLVIPWKTSSVLISQSGVVAHG